MTAFLLFGLIVGIIGSLPFDVGLPGWIKKWIYLTVAQVLFWTVLSYFMMIHIVGPLGGWPLCLLVLCAWVINASICLQRDCHDSPGYYMEYPKAKRSGIATLIGAFVFIILLIVPDCAALRHDEYYAFTADQVETTGDWTDSFSAVDPGHIRNVPRVSAEWKGNKILGQSTNSLGSKYHIGKYTVQKCVDRLVHVAPLEFSGFWRWRKSKTSPAYITISAEDTADLGKLTEGWHIAYMESAFFGHNLRRHIYTHGYQFRGVTDITFEIDDEGRPWYTATLYTPTVFWNGERVDGILLINPETGEMTEKTMDEIPAWVDRVIPRDVAIDRLTWWGKYIHGWWNTTWLQDSTDVTRPTSYDNPRDGSSNSSAQIVWDAQGNATWFTGFTSIQDSDNSLVGIALMDSRTGSVRYYRSSGADEAGILQAVNAAFVNYPGYRGTEPIPYNIYGERTWVVPVVSEDGITQMITLVRGSNSQIAKGADIHSALVDYRGKLQDSGTKVEPSPTGDLQTANGTIDRLSPLVAGGETVFYLTLRENTDTIFSSTVSVSPELTIARPGEEVTIEFEETHDPIVLMKHFNLLSFEAREPAKKE